jgi:hypothetical protein
MSCPENEASESPNTRLKKWRHLVDVDELIARLVAAMEASRSHSQPGKPVRQCSVSVSTINSIEIGRRRPGLALALAIQAESWKDRRRAQILGFELPIRADEWV